MERLRLGIVIVNYKTPKLVIDCLSSLQSEIQVNTDFAVVVDNCSGDGSAETIMGAIEDNNWNSWAKVIPSEVNGGFSAGNNIGLKSLDADYYLLINSDTFVRKDAISSLVNAMKAHSTVGLIGPRLEWPDGTPQNSCFRFHSPWSELIRSARTSVVTKLLSRYDVPITAPDEPVEPQWVTFACVLIRREVIEQVGLMDEGYFMYYEDGDYCQRAQSAGWKVLYWPDAKVVHLRGGSSPVKAELAARKRPRPYLYASRSRYFAKYYGKYTGVLIANTFWLAGYSISLFREVIGNKLPHTCEGALQDIWKNWLNPMQPPTLPGKNV